MNHLPLHTRSLRRRRAAAVIVLLAVTVALFGYHLFGLHDGEHYAHLFDVSAPLLGERILSFLMGSAIAAE